MKLELISEIQNYYDRMHFTYDTHENPAISLLDGGERYLIFDDLEVLR
jgi:hypothetical protein